MPEIETAVRDNDIRTDALAERVGFEPRVLATLMAISLAILVGSPASANQQQETLALSQGGGFIPVYAIVTVIVWIGALEAIRRLTS